MAKGKEKATTIDTMMDMPQKNEAVTQLSTSKHVEDHPDWAEFVQISKTTGTITVEVTELSMEDKAKFDVGFHQWLKAGKPKPTMPELDKGAVEYPICIWIAKSRGKIFMYHDTNLSTRKGLKVGVKEKDGKIIQYEELYSVAKMQALIEQREQLTPVEQERAQCIVINNHTYMIDESDLLKGYEEVASHIITKGN